MKILGIGNAIVDVICKVNDQYLLENGLTKSTMKLVDEEEFKKLLSTLKIEETISGLILNSFEKSSLLAIANVLFLIISSFVLYICIILLAEIFTFS